MTALVLSAVGAALLLFQNCQPPARHFASSSAREDSGATTMPVDTLPGQKVFTSEREAAAEPFAGGKVRLGKVGGVAAGKVAAKAGRVILPAGQRLVVVLDNECVHRSPGPVSSRAYSPGRDLGLKTQTYLWILDQPIALDELQTATENDDCVIGLAHDDVVRAGAAVSLSDPLLPQQSNFKSVGGPESYSFFADPAHGARSTVVVSVIDSGINHAHEDLQNMLWRNPSTDEFAHGTFGYNFYDEDYYVFDSFGHGTFVAGIIAGQANNGIGVTGVMGHDVQIMANKVQDSEGNATIADIAFAIDYSHARGADVVNISMEGLGDNSALKSSMNSAVAGGLVIVSAAGNSGELLDASNIVVPAHYGSEIAGAITVGSIDAYSGARSDFSNYSSTRVEITAPGSNGVYSTTKDGAYGKNEGTSFSAPMVAGAAALVVSFFKKNGISYTPALVESTITGAAIADSALSGSVAGGRKLNLEALSIYLRRKYLAPADGGFDED